MVSYKHNNKQLSYRNHYRSDILQKAYLQQTGLSFFNNCMLSIIYKFPFSKAKDDL